MIHIRSMTAAALATGLVLFASSSVLANSEINKTREERRAYCQTMPTSVKGQCMQQTAQMIGQYSAEHRECLRDPAMDKATCDTEFSAKLDTLYTGGH